MKSKIFYIISAALLVVAMIFLGCPAADTSGSLKLSITDAPAANFKSVVVDFDKVEVSQSATESGASWLTINSDGGNIDLLQLTNGALQDLGIATLDAGKYNQIRIYVSGATITLADDTVIASDKIHVASNTIKLTKPFVIEEGMTTELIVDFDAGHSIVKNDTVQISLYQYTITPVTRIAYAITTGKFTGHVTPIDGKTITVTAYKDGLTTSYAGTICDESGDWTIGYLEAGVYDLKIETDDASADIADKTIVAGEATVIEDFAF